MVNLLIGVTGSVAAIKVRAFVEDLKQRSPLTQWKPVIVATKAGKHFLDVDESARLDDQAVPVLTDEDEFRSWQQRKDPVLHIDLRNWADIFVILPLSANTLAKLAHGLCDNLVTCIARAWTFAKPLLVFPAMNTAMWEHPLTAKHIETIQSFGIKVHPPIAKLLVCGDFGVGGLPEVESCAACVIQELHTQSPKGKPAKAD